MSISTAHRHLEAQMLLRSLCWFPEGRAGYTERNRRPVKLTGSQLLAGKDENSTVGGEAGATGQEEEDKRELLPIGQRGRGAAKCWLWQGGGQAQRNGGQA